MEQLPQHVVFFDCEGCAAECGYAERVVDAFTVFLAHERFLARVFDELRNALERPIQRAIFPTAAERRAIFYGGPAPAVYGEAETSRAFRAKMTAVDRTIGIPLNVEDLSVLT